MEWPSRTDAAVAALAAVTAIGASLAVTGVSRSFVVLSVDRHLVNLAPGAVVAAVIDRFGKAGHLLHQIPAVLLTLAAFTAISLVGLAVTYRTDNRFLGGVVAGLGAWTATTFLAGSPTQALAPGAGLFLVGWLAPRPPSPIERVDVERRSVLRAAGAAVTALGLGGVLEAVGRSPPAPSSLPGGDTTPNAMLSTARERSLAIEGIEPLVSDQFYEVDINPAANPVVSADDWSLTVSGAVETELSIDYDELTAMDRDHRFVTLRCVSDEVNGHLMDNAVWTGVPVASILERATPQPGCDCVMLHAADGYYEEFPLTALDPGLLAYGMNGSALPRNHGYPVRALVPGHWGEVNVKWLTEIEVLDRAAEGYWEQRGWHGTGPVNTVAKIHTDYQTNDGRIVVGGHAYAGTRGIDRVEVSTDGGQTWTTATLSEPLPGDDVWRQWQHRYDPPGSHEVVARAVDGTGTVQPRDEADPFPSGATGWATRRVE
mgnify:CR=1 FL=1